MNRAAFLDRDGVINEKAPVGQYILRWEEMQILPGVVDAIAMLRRHGFLVIVVTNQRCVASGLISENELNFLHKQMRDTLSRDGGTIDAIYYCPHELDPACSCRKPMPGMLFNATVEHQIDLPSSWMIGDTDLDVEAGKNAGCRTARVLSRGETENVYADIFASSLLEATRQIIGLEVAMEGKPSMNGLLNC